MAYLQGLVVPVKPARKDDYRRAAERFARRLADLGALRTVECWGEDVPQGQRTDFRRAVKVQDDEAVVFAWTEWADRAACDEAGRRLRQDPGMAADADTPFDTRRIIYGGYDVVLDTGAAGAFGYVDGMAAPIGEDRRAAYADFAALFAPVLLEHGALRVVDGWGVDVPAGTTTDFRRAVALEEGESVLFGWIEWPTRAARDAAWDALMAEGVMRQHPPVWDGQRAIFAGFAPILDTARG